MLTTIISLIRVAFYMLSKNKERRLALKYDKAGDIQSRDKLVFGLVPL